MKKTPTGRKTGVLKNGTTKRKRGEPLEPYFADRQYALGEFLKGELKKQNLSYAVFARRFAKYAKRESKSSIRNKLARGKFSAAFFITALEILKHYRIDVRVIIEAGRNSSEGQSV